ncbi:hypothetical protein DICPUDRAFT_152155 [Dictyostelium purpureum]|uniref:Transcription factor 25 n=1 Tax=Dictyostelium purpureum TaxID=5786 RepID=F0ZKL6_DICPU|nr:uncharacterized protein DICPUDRAFT_152155 [Dictyostelium purpureum]EGC35534.1 hypothetical protein DICPUDRAFT_152155 [Dictyostelium purpureum]|eukprot:XP_003287960.1 hypothetical protein DICPUDRAFT_152155 [Dictyostelium purpureum]
MSTRALKKKQLQKEVSDEEISTDESDEEIQTVQPKFSMLNFSDDDICSDKSESEESEEEVIPQPKKQPAKPQPKNKKQQQQQQQQKKNKKQNNKNIDKDLEILNSIENISTTPLTKEEIKLKEFNSLFKINQTLLNPDNELKKLFGCNSSDIKGQKKKVNNPHHNRKKNYLFVTPKPEWPDVIGLMIMEIDKDNTTTTTTTTASPTLKSANKSNKSNTATTGNNDVTYFKVKWGQTYSEIQEAFYGALATHDPMNIVAVLRLNPYHIDSLLQLGQVCLQTAEYQQASDFVEMAVFAFESIWHHLFNPLNGNCRFEYKHDQNKSCFLSIFRYIQILGRRGCPRTALEFCKILLTMDWSDPLFIRLIIDYYSIKSKQYQFLLDLYTKVKSVTPTTSSLALLPNFTYSVALSKFYLEKQQKNQLKQKQQNNSDDEEEERPSKQEQQKTKVESSDELLQKALISFPMLLKPLLEKLKVSLTIAKNGKTVCFENDKFFTEDPLEKRIDHLISLYVERSYQLWQPNEIQEWLKKNAEIVLEKVSNKDPLVEKLTKTIRDEYETVNQQVFEHLLLSEYSDAIQRLPPDIVEAMQAEGYENIMPQRNDNQPPQHLRRGGIGGGYQIFQRQHRNRQQQIEQQIQQQLRQQQQFRGNQAIPNHNQPIFEDNPEYNGPENPVLSFFHSLMPWNDPSVQRANQQQQQQPHPGFLDDYVDFEDEEQDE